VMIVSVCRSDGEHIGLSESARSIFPRRFLDMLPVSVARSSSGGVATCYTLPVLRMTSYLHIMSHMQGSRCNTGTVSQPA